MDVMNAYAGLNQPQYQQAQQPQYYQPQYPQQQQYMQAYPQNPQIPQQYQQPQAQTQSQQQKIPHPTEFWATENSETVLFVEDNLSAPNANEYYGAGGSELLMALHSKYSRFRFTIYKTKEKKYLGYNLHPNELAGLDKKLSAITLMELSEPKQEISIQQQIPLAYTVTISTGKLKGETPANLILNAMSVSNEALQQVFNDLESQKNFLLQNVAKYPRNQQQIDAILNAYELYNNQQLVKRDDVSSASKIMLIDEFKIPNAKAQDAEGYTKVTAFKIYYTKGEKYPFSVEITNAKAIPTFHQNGTTTASMANAKGVEKAVYNMSLSSFSDLLSEMKEQKKIFEREIRKEQRKVGVAESLKQISENKK